MKNLIPLLLLAAMLTSTSSPADPGPLAAVLKMMSRVPEKAHQSRLGRYETAPDAREIADAIAAATSDEAAQADAVVFAAYESSNSKTGADGKCIGGDKNAATGEFQSFGVFQLSRLSVPVEVACVPKFAAVEWVRMRDEALRVCAANPPEDRLAWLAAGSCTNRGGLKESRMRARVAAQVLKP